MEERLAPGRSQANYAASNEIHMHDVDMLYAGPRANGREAPANLSPRGQAVVTSLASRFLSLPICRAQRLPRHGSRHGCGLNLRRGIMFRRGPLGERCVSGAGLRRGR